MREFETKEVYHCLDCARSFAIDYEEERYPFCPSCGSKLDVVEITEDYYD